VGVDEICRGIDGWGWGEDGVFPRVGTVVMVYQSTIDSLGDAAAVDGDPRLSIDELNEHMMRSFVAPLALTPLAELLIATLIPVLLVIAALLPLPHLVFWGVRYGRSGQREDEHTTDTSDT